MKRILVVILTVIGMTLWATPEKESDIQIVNSIQEAIEYEQMGYVVNYEYAVDNVYIVHLK